MQHQEEEEEERLTTCLSFGISRYEEEVEWIEEEESCEEGGRITALTGSPRVISAVQRPPRGGDEAEEQVEEEEGDFEFAFVSSDSSDSLQPITADEIFSNGKIRPVYPLFNRVLVFGADHDDHRYDPRAGGGGATGGEEKATRSPIRKLLIEDTDTPSTSCSSSESDELDGIPAEDYCVWAPSSVPPSPDMRKKSNSTGATSKLWRLRELVVGRSHSDGKEKLLFWAAAPPTSAAAETKKKPSPIPNLHPKEATTVAEGNDKKKGKGKGGARPSEMDMVTAHRLYYVKGGPAAADRRRSLLPYRKDLVGFFGM